MSTLLNFVVYLHMTVVIMEEEQLKNLSLTYEPTGTANRGEKLTSEEGSVSSCESMNASSNSGKASREDEGTSISVCLDSSRLLDLDLSHLRTTKESILDELLSDIRRSCGPSLASTPTVASLSEGENSVESVFDCRVRRSEAEMRTLGL